MDKIYTSNKVYVSKSKIPLADRGVFAGVNIRKGETIEICPFIEIPEQEIENLKESLLITYFYFFGRKKERFLTALGFGSIYNHSYSPNSMYKISPVKRTIVFTSLKGIKKDEEITVNYLQGNPKSVPLWFENKTKKR